MKVTTSYKTARRDLANALCHEFGFSRSYIWEVDPYPGGPGCGFKLYKGNLLFRRRIATIVLNGESSMFGRSAFIYIKRENQRRGEEIGKWFEQNSNYKASVILR